MSSEDAPNRRTILIVDDEEMLVELLRRMLMRHGFESISATSAAEALELYDTRKEEIALVITDLVMPGTSGAALVRQLLARDPLLRILVSTGFSATSDISELLALGVRGVVMKPYQSEQLIDRIREALSDPAEDGESGSRPGPDSSAPPDSPESPESRGFRETGNP